MSASVYRCYDADGVLLYVGCAYNPKRRIATHLCTRKTLASHALQTLMARYEVEGPFPTRQAAEDAERTAIETEKPLLNRQHRGGNFGLDYDLFLYLRDRGISIETVGLHRCEACNSLRRHSTKPGMCRDCQEAQAEGRLDEWVQFIADLHDKYGIAS